jgi:hypothetical protein
MSENFGCGFWTDTLFLSRRVCSLGIDPLAANNGFDALGTSGVALLLSLGLGFLSYACLRLGRLFGLERSPTNLLLARAKEFGHACSIFIPLYFYSIVLLVSW